MTESTDPRRERARELRRAGHTLAQIKAELRVGSDQLRAWVRDIPAPANNHRARAKDEHRARARELRVEGLSVPTIAKTLGVARSTVWYWVRDLPIPTFSRERWRNQQYWDRERRVRAMVAAQQKLDSARQIGSLTVRELLIAGVVAYWCEGAKDKSYARRESLAFINSDAKLVTLWLAFLDGIGVARSRLSFRIQIHETADVAAALDYWSSVVQIPPTQFMRTTLKRHNPQSNRRNIGGDYYGCLVVKVRDSAELYRTIEGWFYGIAYGSEHVMQRTAAIMEH
jgi:predicted transcriptional regulator